MEKFSGPCDGDRAECLQPPHPLLGQEKEHNYHHLINTAKLNINM